jgi:hypothetical protein
MKKCATLAALASLACAASPMAAHADEPGKFSLGAGVFRSSGTYGGTQPTDITYVPVIGKYQGKDWTFKLVVPYLQITGPGNVLNGVGLTGNPGTTTRTTQSGLGDVIAAATRRIYSNGASGFMASLTGKIKFGTADPAKGLGTGKNDYAIQSNLFQAFGGLTAFGSAGYKVYGSPAAYTLNNVFYGTLGGSYKFSPDTSGGLALYFRQKALVNGFPRREAMLFVNHTLDHDWKVEGYVLKGFTNASPNTGAGVFLTRLF